MSIFKNNFNLKLEYINKKSKFSLRKEIQLRIRVLKLINYMYRQELN